MGYIHRRGHVSVACEGGRIQVHRQRFTIGCMPDVNEQDGPLLG